MRVLLTTPYDLAVPGGVNRHVTDLLDALGQRGLEARLIGPWSGPPGEGTDARIVRVGGVRVKAMNGARSRVTLDIGIGGQVHALVRAFRPDVIHLQEPFLPLLNTFCLWHADSAACVGTFHTFSETSRGYLWAWPYCRWVNRRLHARVAVSAPAREFATQFHPADCEIVPNGVRPIRPAQQRPLGGLGRPMRVLFVGRADEERKGFKVLLAAMRRLESEAPGQFALTVAGPGDEAWRGAAAGLPVTFTGRVSEAGLSDVYRAADVCVVPSLGGESFGLVALEALAHGVPVVASRIRGYAEWLSGGEVGVLVPPGDGAALAAALRTLVAESGRHQAWAGRAAGFAERFSIGRTCDRLLAVYQDAVTLSQSAGK